MVPIVAPCALGAAAGSLPVYHSQLFVRADSTYAKVEDLRGSTFAYNDETSLSGYNCVKFFLLACNRDSNFKTPFFSKTVRTGAHVNSIEAVLDARASVLALDCNVLSSLQQAPAWREKLEALRPISIPQVQYEIDSDSRYQVSSNGMLGPHPAQPLVVSRRLGPKIIDNIKTALLSLSGDELASIRAKRYMEVDEEYYRGVTAMIRACNGLPILE